MHQHNLHTWFQNRCSVRLLTGKQEEENEAPGQGASEEYPDGGDPGVLVDGVESLELVVGDGVAHEQVALQHGPEHARVPRHGLLRRVHGKEGALHSRLSFEPHFKLLW